MMWVKKVVRLTLRFDVSFASGRMDVMLSAEVMGRLFRRGAVALLLAALFALGAGRSPSRSVLLADAGARRRRRRLRARDRAPAACESPRSTSCQRARPAAARAPASPASASTGSAATAPAAGPASAATCPTAPASARPCPRGSRRRCRGSASRQPASSVRLRRHLRRQRAAAANTPTAPSARRAPARAARWWAPRSAGRAPAWPGPTTVCSPYGCDPARGAASPRCTDSSQCDGRDCTRQLLREKAAGRGLRRRPPSAPPAPAPTGSAATSPAAGPA